MNLWMNDKLKKVQKELNDIPMLNAGGCALVAHAFAEYVNKNFHDLKADIVYIFRDYEEMNYERANNNMACSCTHAVVNVNGIYYDSTGSYTYKDLMNKWNAVFSAKVDSDVALEGIKTYGWWNHMFDRLKYAPKINSLFEVDADYTYDF